MGDTAQARGQDELVLPRIETTEGLSRRARSLAQLFFATFFLVYSDGDAERFARQLERADVTFVRWDAPRDVRRDQKRNRAGDRPRVVYRHRRLLATFY
jgi:hypothetical protein